MTAPTSIRRPPGPSFLGFTRDFVRTGRDEQLEMFQALHDQFGGFVNLPLPMVDIFLTNEPHVIEHVLVKNVRNYQKDWLLRRERPVFGNGLLLNEGESWRRQRRMIQPAFHSGQIETYGRLMRDISAAFVEERWKPGEVVEVQKEVSILALRIVLKCLFDMEETADIEVVAQSIEGGMEHFELVMKLPFLPDWVPLKAMRQYRSVIKAADELIYRFIQQKLEQIEAGQPGDDLLTSLLQARDEDGNPMPHQQIRDEVMTLLLAGHETTAQAVSFALFLLSQNPAEEGKVFDELDQVCADGDPSLADVKDLLFLEQVIKEALRLFPPASMMARDALDEDEIRGYLIPKQASILFSPYLIHRDPRWFDEPDAFRPERWTSDFEHSIPKMAYLPFGGGQRLCIGKGFAMMEATIVLAVVLRRFRLRATNPTQFRKKLSITLRVADGLPMRVETR